jgi:hypothetical protein
LELVEGKRDSIREGPSRKGIEEERPERLSADRYYFSTR